MNTSLRTFISEFAGAVAAALVPVIIITFLTMPLTLGGHPGESRASADNAAALHLS
ncbi:MAG: hypothetical protein ABL931_23760 [Usitatibacteraceae bacterium]